MFMLMFMNKKTTIKSFLIILFITYLLFPAPTCTEFIGHTTSTPVECEQIIPLVSYLKEIPSFVESFDILSILISSLLPVIGQVWALTIPPFIPVALITTFVSKKLNQKRNRREIAFASWIIISVVFFAIYYLYSYYNPVVFVE